jgi:hypothetical protein
MPPARPACHGQQGSAKRGTGHDALRNVNDCARAGLLPSIGTVLMYRAAADRGSVAMGLPDAWSTICIEVAGRTSEMDALTLAVRTECASARTDMKGPRQWRATPTVPQPRACGWHRSNIASDRLTDRMPPRPDPRYLPPDSAAVGQELLAEPMEGRR